MAPGYQLMLPLKGALLEPLPAMFQPPTSPEARTAVRKVSYTVQRGDTLPRIAQRYKVSTDDLRTWNQIGRLAVRPAPGDRGAPDGSGEEREISQEKRATKARK